MGLQAKAAEPAYRIIEAPLVTPSAAWTFYGSGTTHTNGVAAWATNPPEIKAQAKSLGAERRTAGEITADQYAKNVSDYVRNNIATEFRFGLGKGARGALIELSGTPFDQAELAVKLIREGGVTASYQVGTITLTADQFGKWTGLVNSLNEGSQTFTVNAKAACEFLADGGIPATVNGATSCASLTGNLTTVTLGHAWVSANSKLYDPSFKRHTLKAGINVPNAMGCTTSATCASNVSAQALSGSVTGTVAGAPTLQFVNDTSMSSTLQNYAINLQNNVVALNEAVPVEAVVGGRIIDFTYDPTPGATLPYTSAVQFTWTGGVPDQYRTRFRWRHGTLDQWFYVDELAGRRLGVRYWQAFLDETPLSNSTALPRDSQIDHPYAANSGGYADAQYSISPVGTGAIILSLGHPTEAISAYYGDLDLAQPQPEGS